MYMCIDLKTFYASVECVERGLDPFKTNLIVADPDRCNGTICLAISPKMKSLGVKNRCRVFEIPKNIKYIVAKPRMRKYIEYSAKIYQIYLNYFDHNDIHVYSIDEVFIDVKSYLKLYKCDSITLAKKVIDDIFKNTHITATAGIGTNLYLAKVALDIKSKHSKSNIGYLDEEMYKNELWHYTPMSDFWQIGSKTYVRLLKMHIKDMYDLAHYNENKLYKEFGINAKLLIDHAWGVEPCTMEEIKRYKPLSNSISNGQVLFRDYNYKEARIVLTEMVDNIVLELVSKNLYTSHISFTIRYSKEVIPPLKFSEKLSLQTNSYRYLLEIVLKAYDYLINEKYPIRKIRISLSDLRDKKVEQLDMFTNYNDLKEESNLEHTVVNIKNRFGKSSILRGISFDECATQISRNKLIGGHNAE